MNPSFTAAADAYARWLYDLQDQIVEAVRGLDPELTVQEDIWERTDHAGQPGGGGRTRSLTGGVIESGGVNVSKVYGALEPGFAKQLGGSEDDKLFATGISLIFHPRNPHVPTVHMNVRLVAVGSRWWVGGGADLTPHFPHAEDAVHFHRVWADAAAPYGQYEDWKQRCDAYFVNSHRDGEMRGIGGIFYDHVCTGDLNADLAMQRVLGPKLLESWLPIAERRKDEAFSQEDEDFMLWRRGRYVEFNLLHDRGTLFGLRTGGRTASILVSLPARCSFRYAMTPRPGSPQETIMGWYRPHDWRLGAPT